MRPLVSVIITTRNEEDYIKSCLDAIRNQTYEDIEIILVDSCSKDKTREIAKEYVDKLIIKDSTPSEGRNIGAKYAKGDILLFVDADILLTKNWILQMIRSIKDGDVLLGKLIVRERSKKAWMMSLLFYIDSHLLRILGIPMSVGGILIAIKGDIFDIVRGFHNKPGEDTELLKKIRHFRKIIFEPKCLALTSIRRFKKRGYLKQSIIWIVNWLTIIFGFDLKTTFYDYLK